MKQLLKTPFVKKLVALKSPSIPKSREITQKNGFQFAKNQINDRIESTNCQEELSKEIDMKLLKMFDSIKKEVIKELTTKS